jgi:hypothetical protein
MTTAGSGVRASVVRAKSAWLEGKKKIRERHDAGETGVIVTRAMSDLLDSVLIEIYETALREISPDLFDSSSRWLRSPRHCAFFRCRFDAALSGKRHR